MSGVGLVGATICERPNPVPATDVIGANILPLTSSCKLQRLFVFVDMKWLALSTRRARNPNVHSGSVSESFEDRTVAFENKVIAWSRYA